MWTDHHNPVSGVSQSSVDGAPEAIPYRESELIKPHLEAFGSQQISQRPSDFILVLRSMTNKDIPLRRYCRRRTSLSCSLTRYRDWPWRLNCVHLRTFWNAQEVCQAFMLRYSAASLRDGRCNPCR